MASFCFALIFALIFVTSSPSSSLVLPLKTQQISTVTLPKSPNKLRFHHNVTLTVTIAVGSPPQNVSMVLDTGSELSWLPCNSTNLTSPVTGRPSPPSNNYYYNPRSSSSYFPIPCSSPTCQSQTRDLPVPATCDGATKSCHVSLSYADASTSEGSLASDNFLIGDSPPLKTIFGCMESTYSSTASSSDPVTAGLLGMNRGSLSFITQTATRRFSYCISDRDESGLLLIGEPDPRFVVPLNYTPLIQISLPLPYFDRVAYSVQLEGIRVGSVLLPIPKSVLEPDHTGAGQTMVDSGTQFTFLLGSAYDVLKSEFLNQTRGVLVRYEDDPDFVFQGAFDACFKVGDEVDVDLLGLRLPEVTMVFRGAEVRVRGGRLLYRAGEGIRCLTFGNSELIGLEAYVIGHHHQVNVWVEYDLENGRVGFGQVQCDWASQKLGLLL